MSNIPYTYLVGWSKLNRWYYGVRYAKNCSPEDLWTKYFTSSKHVKIFRIINGEPDVIQIRRIFETNEQAVLWETKVLTKLDVINSDIWINRGIAGNYKTSVGHKSKKRNLSLVELYGEEKAVEIKIKVSNSLNKFWLSDRGLIVRQQVSDKSKNNKSRTGRGRTKGSFNKGDVPWNKNTIGLQTAWNKGIENTKQKELMSLNNPMKNPETIAKMAATKRGRIPIKTKCICGKEYDAGNMALHKRRGCNGR